MKIPFTKMQGLGNDFVVIDATKETCLLTPALIQRMADRHFGIGCDQVLLIEQGKNKGTDYNYRIFNADGSEVGQCGNGARCVAHYLYTHGLTTKKEINLTTPTSQLQTRIIDKQQVAVNMGIPTFVPQEIPFLTKEQAQSYVLKIDNENVTVGVVGLGNPHAVLQVSDVDHAPVNTLGRKIERHPQFPQHVNVGFMQIVAADKINLRVFERGVGETLACGSGACAAVIIGRTGNQLDQRVTVALPGGRLIIDWAGKGNPVWMEGPAVEVFTGIWPEG